MRDKELEELVQVLIPYIKRELKKDKDFKLSVKRKNATVVSELKSGASNIDGDVEVILPFDTTSFFVPNQTGKNLNKGDLVCIEYCIDLKNAIAVYKAN